jgi:hypothetical protein
VHINSILVHIATKHCDLTLFYEWNSLCVLGLINQVLQHVDVQLYPGCY